MSYPCQKKMEGEMEMPERGMVEWNIVECDCFVSLTFVFGQTDLKATQKERQWQATADVGRVKRGDMPVGLHGETAE